MGYGGKLGSCSLRRHLTLVTDARNILLGSVKLCAGKGAALPHIIPGRDVGDLIDGLASMGHTGRSAHQGRTKSARSL